METYRSITMAEGKRPIAGQSQRDMIPPSATSSGIGSSTHRYLLDCWTADSARLYFLLLLFSFLFFYFFFFFFFCACSCSCLLLSQLSVPAGGSCTFSRAWGSIWWIRFHSIPFLVGATFFFSFFFIQFFASNNWFSDFFFIKLVLNLN